MNRCIHPSTRSVLLILTCIVLALCGYVLDSTALAQTAGSILPKGTVPSLRGVVSGSAIISTPTPTATGNSLTITQINPQVIIDWNSFNIASGSTVQFIQPSSSASALNRIYGADPSIIQGNLTANGQIFLINQNGILFDRGSQINVNTLYASTLNISNSQFAQGVVGATATTPSFAGGYDSSGNTITTVASTGSIQIGTSGPANAPSPKITAATGGAIVLLAPMINNQSGIISSPDGQVILAAGNMAYLQFPDASDTTLRGLVVQIDASSGPVNISSMVTNMGTISANARQRNAGGARGEPGWCHLGYHSAAEKWLRVPAGQHRQRRAGRHRHIAAWQCDPDPSGLDRHLHTPIEPELRRQSRPGDDQRRHDHRRRRDQISGGRCQSVGHCSSRSDWPQHHTTRLSGPDQPDRCFRG